MSRGRMRRILEEVVPAARFGDERTILAGAGQNAIGLFVAMLATFGTQVLITRILGAEAFGVVTVATQAAFVAAAATRFGMDHAAVRRVSMDVGQGERARVRAVVARAAAIAAVVSVAVGVVSFLSAGPLARIFTTSPDGKIAFQAAALGLPFAALVQVYLGGTRGLKIMRHTLYVFWMGQPLAWIALMLAGWLVSKSAEVSVLAYSGSWVLATAAAAWAWHRATRGFGSEPPAPGEVKDLLRYGAPRAPAALFAQALFWVDLFVLARFAPSAEVGVYAAAVRAGQVILLFLISINYMFSPFVADLHARGERDRLDTLFKAVNRWTLTASLPIFVVLAVAPGPALRLFGAEFGTGREALLILLAGQLVSVAAGGGGFILLMAGRTGWDLIVYAASLGFDLILSLILIPRFGMEGAAVAGALTLGLSNLARQALVWRFLRIQPFTRAHLRLLLPAGIAALAAWGARAAIGEAAWPVELGLTSIVAAAVYAGGLLAGGLPPGERGILFRLVGGVRRTKG